MSINVPKVLIVEDENSILRFISINLNRNNFEVFESDSGESALEILESVNIDIVVLDIMLPGIDGFETCKKIRQMRPDIIIIILSARSNSMDKLMGLDIGADDYMVKPFDPMELVARIRAIMRRTGRSAEKSNNILSCNKLILDTASQKFYKQDLEIELTPTEFSIMKLFMSNVGNAFKRDVILDVIWGKNYFGDLKTVDVNIRRLREKIEDIPSEPKLITTVWGVGYRFEEKK